MLDVADLEVNILEFHGKNFAFDRLALLVEEEFAIFLRTETESESKLRPKLVRLRVVVPRSWVLFDLAADLLVLGRDGKTPGARSTEAAVEAAAESAEFKEQGIAWRRTKLADGGFAYVPEELASRLLESGGLAALGVQ
ncbi:MAG: hypothetical protein WAN87_04550 [Thermoplasmata archaeon]